MYLIFDTETTGLPQNFDAPVTDTDNWPRLVQMAWQLHDEKGSLMAAKNIIVKPNGFTIPYNAEKIHGISTERAEKEGRPLPEVIAEFTADLQRTKLLIAHNIKFDLNILGAEFVRLNQPDHFSGIQLFCTANETTDWMQLSGGRGKYKTPNLTELYTKLFNEPFQDAHDAAYDVAATAKVFFGLIEVDIAPNLGEVDMAEMLYEAPQLDEANFRFQKNDLERRATGRLQNTEALNEVLPFVHLHVHSQYSVLQSPIDVADLVASAKKNGMTAVALTDMGNMMGAFKFVRAALKEDIKPIVGCELFISDRWEESKFTNNDPDRRFTQILLAKNIEGYRNLCRISSAGYTKGFYSGYPRVSKELIAQYKDNLIATTGGLHNEIAYQILNIGEEQAEQTFKWWKDTFGQDFYVELLRHGLEEEERLNEVLLRFCKKYDVKYFAANDVFYTRREESESHEILLAIKEGQTRSAEKQYLGGLTGHISRKKRFALPNDEFFFKSQEDMNRLFIDLPEAIETTTEIADKIEPFKLEHEIQLPRFEIPDGFEDENDFLRHLTYKGAKKRYADITPSISERLDFELETVKKMGFPGYFLIVQDFTTKAREMGVWVGPGRGSAAGSAVAYCLGITNIDPIAYDLLFERFLNPDRISMPDVDIDFDDVGREKVINYVIEKYGREQVAQIVTYGMLGGKSAIKDAARVLELELAEANKLAKTFPDHLKATLKKVLEEGDIQPKLKGAMNSDQLGQAYEFRKIGEQKDLHGQVVRSAHVLEGAVRNTGVHACGVIITPQPMTDLVPVGRAKDSDMQVTQFDNSVAEDAGLLKMDFLGLKTLTILKDAIEMVEENHGLKIDPDEIDLEDRKTYEKVFQPGDTMGVFQFESGGMQKHMRELKPDAFTDLIAMNALYRPGPMAYIPNFVKRKHGEEEVVYDLADMEEYLAETYGITVYQEQVMRLSQKLANFTRGEADTLRKAMGKKQIAVLEKLKPKFLEGCKENGHDLEVCEKVWKDWSAFAEYAFNKSHSTCYAYLAFHTAYLKAHYPAEYMASVLTHNMKNQDDLTKYMQECRRMGIQVLGPDVNESTADFRAVADDKIRFGMAGVKGVGHNVVEVIVTERTAKGAYKDAIDFIKRTCDKSVGKRTYEALVYAGSFDNLSAETKRWQYLQKDESGKYSYLDMLVRYANQVVAEANQAQQSLFGSGHGVAQLAVPKAPEAEPWTDMQLLNHEKDYVGIFISGHPLDRYKIEVNQLSDCTVDMLKDDIKAKTFLNKQIRLAGIITGCMERMSQRGDKFGILTIEDFTGQLEFALFGRSYAEMAHLVTPGSLVLLSGKFQPRYNDPEQFEFRVEKVNLLSEYEGKVVKGVSLKLPLNELTASAIEQIEKLAAKHPGQASLNFKLFAEGEPVQLSMSSQKYRIDVNPDFLEELDRQNVEYAMT